MYDRIQTVGGVKNMGFVKNKYLRISQEKILID